MNILKRFSHTFPQNAFYIFKMLSLAFKFYYASIYTFFHSIMSPTCLAADLAVLLRQSGLPGCHPTNVERHARRREVCPVVVHILSAAHNTSFYEMLFLTIFQTFNLCPVNLVFIADYDKLID